MCLNYFWENSLYLCPKLVNLLEICFACIWFSKKFIVSPVTNTRTYTCTFLFRIEPTVEPKTCPVSFHNPHLRILHIMLLFSLSYYSILNWLFIHGFTCHMAVHWEFTMKKYVWHAFIVQHIFKGTYFLH